MKSLQFYIDCIDKGDTDLFLASLPAPPPPPSQTSRVRFSSQPVAPVEYLPSLPNNYTLLHYAAKYGRTRIIDHLLQNKYYDGTINTILDDFGNNILMEACRRDYFHNIDCVVTLLQDETLDLYHTNKEGQNVLEIVCATERCHLHAYKDRKSCGYEKLCRVLLKSGGPKLLQQTEGMALYYALKNEHRNIVRLFLNPSSISIAFEGYKPRTFDEYSHGALRNCLTPEMTTIVLTEGGANVHARDHQFRTPLHDAAACGRAEVCKVLLAHGADPNALDDNAKNPLFLCCERISTVYPHADWVETVNALLEKGTVLAHCDMEHNLTALQYLLKHKSNVEEAKDVARLIASIMQEREETNMNIFKGFALKSILR